MHGVVIDTRGRPQGIQRMWPMLVVRGVLMGALGVMSLFWPAATATALITVFGIFLIVDGLSATVFGASRRKQRRGGGGWLFQGVVGILVGLVAVIWPTAVAFLALIFVGFWVLLISTLLLGVGLAMRRARHPRWGWPVGLAAVGIVFGIVIVANPVSGVLGLATLLGLVLLVAGIALVAGGLRLKRWQLT